MTRPPAGVTVRHGAGSYEVRVGRGLLNDLPGLIAGQLPGRPCALIADERVLAAAPRWLPELPWPRFPFPAGEGSKNVATWAALSDSLLEAGIGRDGAVLALGGGVTGDLAGFVAATFMRGIPLVQLPTSLVAMVDASIGGKVGINTARGKNLLGAFHAPVAVLADTRTLETLPEEEYRAGLAEAVKHGLVADRGYFEWIEANAEALVGRDAGAVLELVRGSVAIKAAIVSADERESGRRVVLNAGHTVAHALEQASGWRVRHGEAVAIGLVVEADLAAALGVGPRELAGRLARLLTRLGLPVKAPPGLRAAEVLGAMGCDKKNRDREVRFAFPSGVGVMHQNASSWTASAERQIIEKVLIVHGVNVST